LSNRRRVRRSDSSRVASVWRVSASNSSSAARFSQVLATLATSVICAALRPSSVARYCASAASLRLAMRPKKSISQLLAPRLALNRLASWPCGLGAREALTVPATVGNRSALRMSYCARACAMLSTATRRSRLLRRAVAIRPRRRSSAKNRCQGSSAAGVPSGAAGEGKAAGTGAAGRSYVGISEQPARASAAASAARVRVDLMGGRLRRGRGHGRIRACTACAGARCRGRSRARRRRRWGRRTQPGRCR